VPASLERPDSGRPSMANGGCLSDRQRLSVAEINVGHPGNVEGLTEPRNRTLKTFRCDVGNNNEGNETQSFTVNVALVADGNDSRVVNGFQTLQGRSSHHSPGRVPGPEEVPVANTFTDELLDTAGELTLDAEQTCCLREPRVLRIVAATHERERPRREVAVRQTRNPARPTLAELGRRGSSSRTPSKLVQRGTCATIPNRVPSPTKDRNAAVSLPTPSDESQARRVTGAGGGRQRATDRPAWTHVERRPERRGPVERSGPWLLAAAARLELRPTRRPLSRFARGPLETYW
jgi:hypothetical protein